MRWPMKPDHVSHAATRALVAWLFMSSFSASAHAGLPTSLVFASSDSLLPGRTVTLHPVLPADLVLDQHKGIYIVPIRSGQVTVTIDQSLTGTFRHFTISGLTARLGGCRYDGINVDSCSISL